MAQSLAPPSSKRHKPKTEFIGGGRGSDDGTIIVVPAVRRGGRIIEPERILVRVRRHGREKKRLAESRTHAKELRRDLIEEFKREQVAIIVPPSKTFKELAEYYEREYLQPPKRNGDGLRSWDKLKSRLKTLKAEFGEEPLRSIDYARIDDFRKRFQKTKTWQKKDRGVTSVNRALSLLRRMLNLARQKPLRWISEDPFADGPPLIRTSLETKRMRILSHAEERALLAQCKAEKREHLRPALIFAIDTAARAGEQFSTRVRDVDLGQGFIRIRAGMAKTGQERLVPITERLRRELLKLKPMKLHLRGKSMRHRDELIFDFRRPKTSFASACKDAGIENFRWHDLRHTGTMRMLEAGVDPATCMKVTGHTNWTTFMRYVNLNAELMRGVASKLDQSRSKKKRSRAA